GEAGAARPPSQPAMPTNQRLERSFVSRSDEPIEQLTIGNIVRPRAGHSPQEFDHGRRAVHESLRHALGHGLPYRASPGENPSEIFQKVSTVLSFVTCVPFKNGDNFFGFWCQNGSNRLTAREL